jgi:hypothetical protein
MIDGYVMIVSINIGYVITQCVVNGANMKMSNGIRGIRMIVLDVMLWD